VVVLAVLEAVVPVVHQTRLAPQVQLTLVEAAEVLVDPALAILAEQAVQALLSLDHSTLSLQLQVLLL
jgi:hypothetical protein